MVLEKTLESPLDCKEIQPVHSEGDQPWDFFGRNDAKAEPRPGSPVPSTPERREGLRACYWEGPSELSEVYADIASTASRRLS